MPPHPRTDTDESTQGQLVESAHITFTGMSLNALETPPQLDDRMKFEVTAVCNGSGLERRKDGELRKTMKMEVIDVQPIGEIEKPERDPELPYDTATDED